MTQEEYYKELKAQNDILREMVTVIRCIDDKIQAIAEVAMNVAEECKKDSKLDVDKSMDDLHVSDK